jgi:hypothetical protein
MLSISMQKRAGLLYLAKSTGRILLILENEKWTVPTFERENSLIEDSKKIVDYFFKGKIIPIELYKSIDEGFEFSTYICLVPCEFLTNSPKSYAWCELRCLPKNLHTGLKYTLSNSMNQTKISTILEIENNHLCNKD